MFCANCGASNESGARYCINCGDSVVQIQAVWSFFNKLDFLRVLTDFSFNRFISPRIVKLLYGLSVLSACLLALLLVVAGFSISTWFGILVLVIGAPLTFLLGVIYSRILLETILVMGHMADQAGVTEKWEPKDAIQWKI